MKIAVIPIDNRPICYDLIEDILSWTSANTKSIWQLINYDYSTGPLCLIKGTVHTADIITLILLQCLAKMVK